MLPPPLRWLATAAFSIASLSSVAGAAAGEPVSSDQEPSPEPPVFTFNVSATGYPPYLIHNGDGSYGGIMIDVVSVATERLGYELNLLQIPRKRVDSLLLEGLIDGTPRALEWVEAPEQFVFSDPVVSVREVFFSPVDSGFRYHGLETLQGVTVVTPLGYHYPQLQSLFDEGVISRYEVADDKDIFTYLLHGRGMDIAIADLAVGQWVIRQHGWQGKFRYSERSISDYGYRLMLRPELTGFAEDFNQVLAEMKASGELDQILDQYR